MKIRRPIILLEDEPMLSVADAFGDLCALFCESAIQVWKDLEDTRSNGAALSEDSITDYLLLNMSRRSNHVTYYRYNRHEESRVSGADWLWLFIENGLGFPLLMQAKRLYPTLQYEKLKHEPRKRKDQLTLLESYARRWGFFPLVCFYNQWQSKQTWAEAKFPGDVRLWGCSIAAASQVKNAMRAGASTFLASIGPLTLPWHFLVCPGVVSDDDAALAPNLPERVRSRLIHYFPRRKIPQVRKLRENFRSLLEEGGNVFDDGPNMRQVLAGVVVVGSESVEGTW